MVADQSVLNSSLHGILLLLGTVPGNFLPHLYPRLHQKQHGGDILHSYSCKLENCQVEKIFENIFIFTNKREAERPGEIVLLPVRHEAPAVPLCPEDDEGDCSTNSGRHEVYTDPAENLDSVVLVNTEQVHQCQCDGYQHPDEAESEEKLSSHEKC